MTITASEWAAAYQGLVETGRRPCPVVDWHKGRWWPSYAITALRHREARRCPTPRCEPCRRARAERWL